MRALAAVSLLLLLSACSSPPPPHAFDALVGQTGVVTLTNLHPDEPRSRLFSINYQQAGLIPVCSAVTLLERNLQEPEESVRVSIRPNEILIKTDRSTIYSRLVEGRFPNYQQALPQKNEVKIPLTVGPFMTAVRQAAIMTDEETKRVVFTFAKQKLTLQARGVGAGSSKVEMELKYSGDPVEISFDPKFLLEMLRVLEPETELSLELVDGKSPALFRNDAGDYLYVVVPMVVKDQ